MWLLILFLASDPKDIGHIYKVQYQTEQACNIVATHPQVLQELQGIDEPFALVCVQQGHETETPNPKNVHVYINSNMPVNQENPNGIETRPLIPPTNPPRRDSI